MKMQNELADNTALRAENERIYCENLAIRVALKNVICTACGGPPFNEEEDEEHILENLKLENTLLKEEHEKVSWFLSEHTLRPTSQIPTLSLVSGPPFVSSMGSFPTQLERGSGTRDLDLTPGPFSNSLSPFHLKGISDLEKRISL